MKFQEAYERQMKSLLGEAGFFAYLRAMERPYTRGLRLRDPERPLPEAMAGWTDGSIPWAEGASYLAEDVRPGLSPLHEAGAFYLQEPSAMAPAAVLAPQPGERVLDLCAAPGGKSTQLAGRMRGRGVLVCNEPVMARARILSRNIERLGVTNAIVTCALPEALAPRFTGYFDKILVDAPCSGEGLFRRQPEAMDEWDADAPARCAARQRGILRAAAMLRPGGRLVYSTCTFNDVENESVIQGFLEEHPDFASVPFALPGLPEAKEGMLHLYPHEIRGEGHFVACLQRTGDARLPFEGAPAPQLAAPLPEVFAPGRAPAGVRQEKDLLYIPPEDIDMGRLRGIAVLRRGLELARVRGNRAEPEHALALALRPEDAARTHALTLEEAALFQAGEQLSLGDLPPGYTLLICHGFGLGWGKQAGGVMKNHYPKGLRRRLG